MIDARQEELEAEYFGSFGSVQQSFDAVDPILEAAYDDEDVAAIVLNGRSLQPGTWQRPLVVEPVVDTPF